MKRNILLIGLICTAVSLFSSLSLAKDAEAPLTGTWDCLSKGSPSGDMPFTLYLQQDGENVDGSVSSPLGDAPISVGTFKQGVLEFEISSPDGSYILTAKLAEGKLSGNWSLNNDKGTWQGSKETPAAK
jgi:hypothetical protein